ncbi:Spore germination protein B3 precursor [compost metagenome]
MCRRQLLNLMLIIGMLLTQTGCWSSFEIEDLSLYGGLALDEGEPTETEKDLNKQGGSYPRKNLITATVQIVPVNSFGSKSKSDKGHTAQYLNISETGDSLLEILRQYSVRLERMVIGHHLKVIIISTKLAQKQSMDQILDFVLRDNDIRPSCTVFLSEGKAMDVLEANRPGEVPAFRIRGMLRNHYRTSKVMKGVNLSQLDALMNSKRSFVLQNIISTKKDLEFAGAGIIKGQTGNWIGSLDQPDVESISWIKGEVQGGAIKSYTEENVPIIYEIKSMKSKMKAKVQGDDISFHVDIQSQGRFTENWDIKNDPSKAQFMEEAEKIFEKRLSQMMNSLMWKMQSKYKVDVAGFGECLSIQHPHVWKKVKDHWDEEFSQIPVTFDIKLKITDFGSSLK